jgi:hypothetical protein
VWPHVCAYCLYHRYHPPKLSRVPRNSVTGTPRWLAAKFSSCRISSGDASSSVPRSSSSKTVWSCLSQPSLISAKRGAGIFPCTTPGICGGGVVCVQLLLHVQWWTFMVDCVILLVTIDISLQTRSYLRIISPPLCVYICLCVCLSSVGLCQSVVGRFVSVCPCRSVSACVCLCVCLVRLV